MSILTRVLKSGFLIFQASVKNKSRLVQIQLSIKIAKQVLYELPMVIKFSQLLENQLKQSYSGWLLHRIEKQPELLKPVVSNQLKKIQKLKWVFWHEFNS